MNYVIPSYEKIARIEGSSWYSRIVNIDCYITGTSTGVSPVFDGTVSRERYTSLFGKIKGFFGNRNNSTTEVCYIYSLYIYIHFVESFLLYFLKLPTTIRTNTTQSHSGGHVLGTEMGGKIPQFVSLKKCFYLIVFCFLMFVCV